MACYRNIERKKATVIQDSVMPGGRIFFEIIEALFIMAKDKISRR
jgi:hypothetical protein